MKDAAERGAGIMSAMRPSLDDIARRVSESQRAVGLLLYGSYATGETAPDSDVDLICVTKSQRARHTTVNVGGIVVDIYASTRPLLEQAIRSDKGTNDNFVLEAFAHGRALITGDGSTQALMSLAREVWEAGPSQPGPDEQRSIASAVQKAVVAARKFAAGAGKSPEWRGMANVELSHLFVHTVHAYCRVHRLWASTIWGMLRWTTPQYFDLIAMCRRYLRAETLEGRVSALADIADVTLGRISLDIGSNFFR